MRVYSDTLLTTLGNSSLKAKSAADHEATCSNGVQALRPGCTPGLSRQRGIQLLPTSPPSKKILPTLMTQQLLPKQEHNYEFLFGSYSMPIRNFRLL